MGGGTPDFTVGEAAGTPDASIADEDILTAAEAASLYVRRGDALLPGMAVEPRIKTGQNYYYSGASGYVGGGSAFAADFIYAYPFFVPKTIFINRIGVEVTGAVASSTIRCVLYTDDGDGFPGALAYDPVAAGHGSLIDSSSTGFKEIVAARTLDRGLYWLAAGFKGGAPSCRRAVGHVVPISALAATTPFNAEMAGYRAAFSGATPPDPFVATAVVAGAPRVYVRVA